MAIVVVRPEPGHAATIAALREAGLEARSLPLFAARPLDWIAPELDRFDAILFTSAQGVRLAGPALEAIRCKPVIAVGPATAAAAREAGLSVVLTGTSDAAAVADTAQAQGYERLLHLAGRDRVETDAMTRIVYAADPVVVDSDAIRALAGEIILLHSARAAARLAELADDAGVPRTAIALVAISAKTAAAAGMGWRALAIAAAPRDDAMVAAARALTEAVATGISGA